MKIKQIHIVSLSFIVFCFLLCLAYSLTLLPLPVLIASTERKYRLLCCASNFIIILPAVFFTSALIGWAIDFGAHPENSRLRFSAAMFGRLRTVFINALIFVAMLTFAQELVRPRIETAKKSLEELPPLMAEYQASAVNAFANQRFEEAFKYARLASAIEPDNPENKLLLYKTEAQVNETNTMTHSIVQTMNVLTFGDSSFGIPKEKTPVPLEPFESFKLFQTAQKCYAEEDWFGAHYYSQSALKSANEKDVNITEYKLLAADAWNKLNQARGYTKNSEQNIFEKKYEGYVALINGDILRAYYIFNTLSHQSKVLSMDSDVERYLKISKTALENQYFYNDETFNLKGFETANNVYFKVQNPLNGTTDVFYIKGVTSTGKAANMIQYLRGLTAIHLSPEGEYLSGIYVPYAKMKNIETRFLDEETRAAFALDKSVRTIPYIQLNSIDRNLEGFFYRPVNIGGSEENSYGGYMILPIPYSDFNYIKEASKGASAMQLASLLSFYEKAEKYGFSGEIFCHSLMNRLLSPLYTLIVFVALALTAWNCRMNENAIFKFHWIYIFPLLSVLFVLFKLTMDSLFRLINLSILGYCGTEYSLVAALALYTLFLFMTSLAFLSKNNSGDW